MLTATQILTFLISALLITATPGPDNLMVLSMGMSKGRWPGIVFGLGCALGCVSHTALAVMGVSAMLAASPAALAALTWIGGAYLIWLGYLAFKGVAKSAHIAHENTAEHAGPGQQGIPPSDQNVSLKHLFFKGVFANAINPKVGLFFLSFLPQFVLAEHGDVALQLGLLGLIFTAQAALLFGLLGYFAGHIGGWLHRRPHAGLWMDRAAGAVFVALGLRIIASR